MARRAGIILLFLTSSLFGVEREPWFNPPFEFHLYPAYDYSHTHHLKTESQSYSFTASQHWTELNLQVSPWPYWDLQLQVAGAANRRTNYTFASGEIALRYNWMDDTVGSPISLVTGVDLDFVRSPFLEDPFAIYAGYFNTEFNLALGKAFYPCHSTLWTQRIWGYVGYGIANRGDPWINSYFDWDYRFTERLIWSWRLNARWGTGNRNLTLGEDPFPGYAHLNYRLIDLAAMLDYNIPTYFTARLYGQYNLNTKNGPSNYFKVAFQLNIPLSL